MKSKLIPDFFSIPILLLLFSMSRGDRLPQLLKSLNVDEVFSSDDSTTSQDFTDTTDDNDFTSTFDPIDRDVCPPFLNDTESALFPHQPVRTTTRCGEVYKCPSGGIFYKPFEAVLRNERCIWTIFAAGATDYEVTIQYFGYEPQEYNEGDYGLIISGFGGSRKPTHFIPGNTTTTTIRNSTLLFVTFFSGAFPNNQSGFILQYKALFDGVVGTPVSASSQHFLIGSEEYFHKYPATGNYRTSELTSFVFTPENNVYRDGKDNAVVYMRLGLNACTEDHLKIYSFNTTCIGPEKWQFEGRVCGPEPTRELIRSPEPTLIIFESGRYASTGFQFTYSAGL